MLASPPASILNHKMDRNGIPSDSVKAGTALAPLAAGGRGNAGNGSGHGPELKMDVEPSRDFLLPVITGRRSRQGISGGNRRAP